MLADEMPAFGALSLPHRRDARQASSPVEDVDAVMERAREAGATILRPAQDQFYGERRNAGRPVRTPVVPRHA